MNRKTRRAYITSKTKCHYCNLRITDVDDLQMWDNVKMHKACSDRYWSVIRAAVHLSNREKEH